MFTTRRQITALAIGSILALGLLAASSIQQAHGAPATSSSGSGNTNSNGRSQPRLRLLSNLFRRQTSGSQAAASSSTPTTTESNDGGASGAGGDEAQSQVEADAQKFLESIPGASGQNQSSGPSSFRERVTDTFGLLREGVGNQFRSLRENFSDTVEELRDTWSSSGGSSDRLD